MSDRRQPKADRGEKGDFQPKFTSRRIGRYVACPGSFFKGPLHFCEVFVSKRGALFFRCGFCDCRTFLYGEDWLQALERPQVDAIMAGMGLLPPQIPMPQDMPPALPESGSPTSSPVK